MSTYVKTGKCRASYVHIITPQSIRGSDPKYSISLIIPKEDTTTIRAIEAAVEEAIEKGIKEKWGGKRPQKLSLPLHDGDDERENDPNYSESYYVNASSTEQPGVVDNKAGKDGKPIPITDLSRIYSGCYVRATINLYPFNTNGNRGVAVGLNNLQFWCDGEPLNGRTRAEDDFEPLEAEDEDDFLS